MESSGFIYSDWLTTEMRNQAKQDSNRLDLIEDMKTKNRTHYAVAQHLWTSLQVCILFVCLLPMYLSLLHMKQHVKTATVQNSCMISTFIIEGLYQPSGSIIAR